MTVGVERGSEKVTITSADGTKLAARCSGHGSPLVLVHGANGDLDTFALIEDALAQHHTVWVYSRRGRGGSGDSPGYALEREVEDLLAVLAVAGDGAHLVGHSGGAIYSLLATEDGPLLSSLVLYEPPLHFERLDPSLIDRVRVALDAADPDGALEILFPAIGVSDTEAHVLRSVESVWERLRQGVRLVPPRTADRVPGDRPAQPPRPAGHTDALPLRREDRRLSVPYCGRSSRTVAESSAPPPSRPAAPRLRLRPNTIRPGDPAVHHRTRPLSTPRSSESTGPRTVGSIRIVLSSSATNSQCSRQEGVL